MKRILIITVAILALGISSCTKSSDNNTTGGIYNKQLNLSYTVIVPTQLYGFSLLDDTTLAASDKIYLYLVTNSFYLTGTFSQELAYTAGTNAERILKVYATDEVISSANTWDDGNSGIITWGYRMSGGNIDGNVTPGTGDKFIGIRLTLSDNKIHYGWVRLNYSSNGKTVNIVEYAYNKTANASIKAGEK